MVGPSPPRRAFLCLREKYVLWGIDNGITSWIMKPTPPHRWIGRRVEVVGRRVMGQQTQQTIKPGTRGTYAGFPAVVVRQYDGGMYEIRVPGGLTCVWIGHFVPEAAK